jgi:hypothetical protein
MEELKMKRYMMSLSALLIIAAVCLTPLAINAKSKTRLASGGFFLWLGEPGTANCVHGTPTGYFPPCSPNTKMSLWRNFTGPVLFDNVTGGAAPFISGAWEIRGSCNLDKDLLGPCWGTFEGNALDGKWEGTWNGKLDFAGFGGDMSFVGHGTGGVVDGLHMKMEAVAEGTGDPYAPMPFTARVFKIEE